MTLRSWLRYGSNPPGPAWATEEHPWNIPRPVVCIDPCWIVGRGRWVDIEWWPWLPWRLFHTVPAHYRKGRLYGLPALLHPGVLLGRHRVPRLRGVAGQHGPLDARRLGAMPTLPAALCPFRSVIVFVK